MSSRPDFEIRPAEVGEGWLVYSYTSWWGRDGSLTSAGGLIRTVPFSSPTAAIAWFAEQFGVPCDSAFGQVIRQARYGSSIAATR